MKILVIEDGLEDLSFLETVSSDEWQLIPANRLKTGIDLLKSDQFDLILLDLNLPDSSGTETLSTLLEEKPIIPVIVLSAMSYDEELENELLLSKGASGYLPKDLQINPETLRLIFRQARLRHQQNPSEQVMSALENLDKSLRGVLNNLNPE